MEVQTSYSLINFKFECKFSSEPLVNFVSNHAMCRKFYRQVVKYDVYVYYYYYFYLFLFVLESNLLKKIMCTYIHIYKNIYIKIHAKLCTSI